MVDKHFRLKKSMDISLLSRFSGTQNPQVNPGPFRTLFWTNTQRFRQCNKYNTSILLSSFQKRCGLHYVNVVVNGNYEEVSPIDNIIDFSIVDVAYTNDKNHTQLDEFHSLPNPCPSIIDIESIKISALKKCWSCITAHLFIFRDIFLTNYPKWIYVKLL